MNETHPTLRAAAVRFAQAARALASRTGVADDGLTPQLIEVLELLAEQAEWRVFVDGTRNFGHQAATVMLLRRLIDLSAFCGRVVLIYADYGRADLGNTAAKLALMFPGIDPGRMGDALARYGTCRDIRFLPFERRSELPGPIAFGFTGGADDMSVNYALQLKVAFFARIQPYLWDDPPTAKADAYYESSRIEQPQGAHLYLLDAFAELQYLASRATLAPADWRWYADQQTFDQNLAHRSRNVRAVLGTPTQHWPVYGLQHFREHCAELLLTCVLLALKVQGSLPGPVVLCSFSPLEDVEDGWVLVEALARDLHAGNPDLAALRSALRCRHAQGALAPGVMDAWLGTLSGWLMQHAHGTEVRVHRTYDVQAQRWIDCSEALQQALQASTLPSVHVVELGCVPMDVFNQCLVQGQLPSVIEGQNAANLMTALGKPFLQLLRHEHVIKNGYARHLPGSRVLQEANEAAEVAALMRDLLPFSATYCRDLERIANYLCAAASTGTPVAGYFAQVGWHCSQNTQDKLLMALLAMRETMLAAY
ncbi:hypothetical protein [Pseudomonas putida]